MAEPVPRLSGLNPRALDEPLAGIEHCFGLRVWIEQSIEPPAVHEVDAGCLSQGLQADRVEWAAELPANPLVGIHPQLLQLAVQRTTLHADELRGP